MALGISLDPDNIKAPVAARPSDTIMATGCNLDPRHLCSLWWHHRPQNIVDLNCDKTTDTDMVPRSSLASDVTMVSAGSSTHPDQHGPGHRVALGHLYGPRWQPRTLGSAWPSVVSGSTDTDYCRAMDPEMTPYCSQGSEVTMAQMAATDHPDQHGSRETDSGV